MNRSRTIASLAIAASMVMLAAALAFADTKTKATDDIMGRWNLTVGDPPHTYPCWLGVKLRDRKYVARFLHGAGSVHDIGEIKFEKSKVEFSANDRKWTAALKGDTLTGTAAHLKNKDDKIKWVGQRSVRKIDLNGKWHIKLAGVPVAHPPAVELVHKDDKVTGKFKEGDKTVDIANVRLTGGLFTFHVPGPTGKRTYSAGVKGDTLEGIFSDGRRRHRFTGSRQREWSEPVQLFNGKDLNNWKPLGDPNNFHWKVIDGIMTNTGGGGAANIVSKQKFRDFRMHVEFKVPQGGNSGVYLRGRHEIQVSDSGGHPASWHVCGALYSRIAPNLNAARKHDEWQTLDVTLVGAYLTVVHNGQIIINNEEMEGITGGAIDSKEAEPGPIYLQGDHGPVSYRKITIWPAKQPPATARAAPSSAL